MFAKPKTVVIPLGAVCAALFVASTALGSNGTTDGDPDLGQKIANITMPLAFLALLVLLAIGIAWGLSRRRTRRAAR